MGIRANVSFIPEQHCNQWDSRREAFEGQRWMFQEMSGRGRKNVRAYLAKYLVHVSRRLALALLETVLLGGHVVDKTRRGWDNDDVQESSTGLATHILYGH